MHIALAVFTIVWMAALYAGLSFGIVYGICELNHRKMPDSKFQLNDGLKAWSIIIGLVAFVFIHHPWRWF